MAGWFGGKSARRLGHDLCIGRYEMRPPRWVTIALAHRAAGCTTASASRAVLTPASLPPGPRRSKLRPNAAARLEHPTRRRIPAAPNCRGAEASRRRYRGSFGISRGPVGTAAMCSLACARLSKRNDTCPSAQPQRRACGCPAPLSRTWRRCDGIARALPDGQCRFRHVPAPRHLHAEPARENPLLGSADRCPPYAKRKPCIGHRRLQYLPPISRRSGAIDATAHYMDAIEQIGFCDLWRHRYPNRREYSWFSTRNNGSRIDHAFLSRELAAGAGTVHYSHEERIAGISDHSPR